MQNSCKIALFAIVYTSISSRSPTSLFRTTPLFQSDLRLSMLFDARLRPAYSPARVNRALVTNGRIGCVGLSHIHNEYPYQRYEQQNEGFMTGLKSRQFLCECVQNFSDLFPTSPTHSTYLALPQPKFLQRTKNVFNILNPPSPHFKLLQCTSKHFKTFPTHFKTSLKCF